MWTLWMKILIIINHLCHPLSKNVSFFGNPGMMFDSSLMLAKSSNLSSTISGGLHLIHVWLLKDTKSIINAFISSRLDYCNGILTGINKMTSCRIQIVQNARQLKENILYCSPLNALNPGSQHVLELILKSYLLLLALYDLAPNYIS